MISNSPALPETGPLTAAVQHVLPSVRADLERLVRIPSGSADPAAAPHLRGSASAAGGLPPPARPPGAAGGAPVGLRGPGRRAAPAGQRQRGGRLAPPGRPGGG